MWKVGTPEWRGVQEEANAGLNKSHAPLKMARTHGLEDLGAVVK